MNSHQRAERIEQLDAEITGLLEREYHLELMVQYPPAGCRHNRVWREVKQGELDEVRRMIAERREEMARLAGQLEFPAICGTACTASGGGHA